MTFINLILGRLNYVIEIEKNIGIPLSLGVVYAYYDLAIVEGWRSIPSG